MSRREGVCAVCARKTAAPPPRMAGQPLCVRCFGRRVVIRTATREDLGARTFYVQTFTGELDPKTGKVLEYTVKLIARRYHCTCPDFANRGVVLVQPCKHVRLVRLLARAAGGLRQVPAGATLHFRLADTATVRRERRAVS